MGVLGLVAFRILGYLSDGREACRENPSVRFHIRQ